MDKKNRNAYVTIIAAVLLIVALIAVSVRLYHYLLEKMDHHASDHALSSEETVLPTEIPADISESASEAERTSETVPVSYPAETLPDYEIHTIPPTSEESTTEEPSSEETTTAAPETTVSETTTAEETTEAPESTAESIPSETSTEFSENSDNLPYIGTWRLEYDLAPAQAAAVNERYALPRLPETPVILRLYAELLNDGTFRLVFTQEDADAFKTALSGWYSDCASIYADSGAGTVQKAAFASWAAYRKGLYALLSPDTVNRIAASWYAEGNTIYVTDDGVVQAEIMTVFAADELSVTGFSVSNSDYRDTVALMQSSLGFTPPFHLIKD